MGCGGSKDQNLSLSQRTFLTMLSSKPSMTKFGRNLDSVKILTKAIASPIFGGSCLLPIGAQASKKRIRSNPLAEEIRALNPETIYGGGHYILNNIRESVQTQTCYDIQILVPVVKDKEILHKLKIIHDLSVQSLSINK